MMETVVLPLWSIVTASGLALLILSVAIWRAVSLSLDMRAVSIMDNANKEENAFLRGEFSILTGWDKTGNIPPDPAVLIREMLTRKGCETAHNVGGDQPLYELIVSALRTVTTQTDARFASGHGRLIEMFDVLAAEPGRIAEMLKRSEVKFLVQMTMQFQTYYPNSPFRTAYEFALAALNVVAERVGQRLLMVRPLTIVRAEEVDEANEDYNRPIEDRLILERARLEFDLLNQSVRRDTHVLVVDCVAPGQAGQNGYTKPQALVFNSSWI